MISGRARAQASRAFYRGAAAVPAAGILCRPVRPPHRMRDRSSWQAPLLALVGSLGIAAAWVLAALALDRHCGWMAVVAAVDAALLLRLGGMRGGAARVGWALAATLLAVALANWGVVATRVGRMFGLMPLESMERMGAGFAWTLAQLANGPVELAWIAAALVIAVVAAR